MELREQQQEIQRSSLGATDKKVLNSPVASAENKPSKPKFRSFLESHYDAWGGEGLDSLLNKAKKGGGTLYDLHVNNVVKKREQKALEKDK